MDSTILTHTTHTVLHMQYFQINSVLKENIFCIVNQAAEVCKNAMLLLRSK